MFAACEGDDDEGGAKSDVATTTIELASLVLGSESFAERVYDADAVDGEAFPPAFAGYRRVRVGVCLVEAPAEDAAGDDVARAAARGRRRSFGDVYTAAVSSRGARAGPPPVRRDPPPRE